MKLSSKSIFRSCYKMSLSSSSFNKRVVTNGQASPMFPSTASMGRKRGSGVENPEPSSPKVTCIGQVRVKAKKRGARAKSKRAEENVQVGLNPDIRRQKSHRSQSFKHQNQILKQEQDRKHRWVHFHLTICEALKDLSCLFHCTREKEEKGKDRRWMVTMEEGKRENEIKLVMGEEEEEEIEERTKHRRKHVFEDIDLNDIEKKVKNEEIPPKNALLLMRCRSDPIKVAALANKFLDPTLHKQVSMEEDRQVHENEENIELVDTKEEDKETNEVAEPIEDIAEKEKDEDEDAKGSDIVGTLTENDIVAKATEEEEEGKGSKERESRSNLDRGSGSLPECLLLMMCEPKLSIEVSKETWVCTADFVRWLPPRPAAKTGGGDRQGKKRVTVECKPPLAPIPPPVIQPGRSSCSFPEPVVGPNGDVLKRCKSEPRGSAAAKFAPEGCLWNKRKLVDRES
ncbi:PREDICTED: uncharacterized protein LOC109353989 [Lupinus angustifolius]|uniref:uncharacterized protein LOC109353989 n=1 Tax=Lupinus angustifolius TaxID=3871 RepID=UPI00092EB459|nr:PREDICTED: uncharacterized protein LOC109353989 [Lupinus angustifolius]